MSEIDRLVGQASPVDDADVASVHLEQAEAELLEEIMSTDVVELDIEDRRSVWRTRIAAAAAGVAAVSLVGALLVAGGGTDVVEGFSPAAVSVAKANSRLLVGAGSWRVTRADEFMVDSGEMTFSDGRHDLDLQWLPADRHDEHVAGLVREEATEIDEGVVIAGLRARVFAFDGDDHRAVRPPEGKHFVTIRGDVGSRDAFLEVVRSIRAVDVETWLAAMPSSVVTPDERAAAVDEMLRGIPLPAGFDVSALREGDALKDRYQLGALVSGAVACAWLDRWTDAKAAGETGIAGEAEEAMGTSRGWPILQEMDADGDYPEVVWEFADWMTKGTVPGHGWKTSADQFGRADYAAALGCDDSRR